MAVKTDFGIKINLEKKEPNDTVNTIAPSTMAYRTLLSKIDTVSRQKPRPKPVVASLFVFEVAGGKGVKTSRLSGGMPVL